MKYDKKMIGTIIGSTTSAVAITTGIVVTAVLASQQNSSITITSAMSQAIYDGIVSDIPTGKISIEVLNSPSNINKLKRKIASILNISVTNITDIKFSNANSSNMVNVTITFDKNFKFNIDDNDLCFKQNKNTIISKKSFYYDLPPYHISADIEKEFNTKITQYLEKQKDPVHHGVYLDQINSPENINSLISELNNILSQNDRTIEIVSILFSVNEASTNSGVYVTISFNGKIGIDKLSNYIHNQNSNTLTSRQPFPVNVIEGQELTNNYLKLIDIPAISQALSTYGTTVQEIVNYFASNNNSLNEFVFNYLPVGNKEINASLKLIPNNNGAVQLTIYFVGTFDFIKLTIYPSFGNKIVNDYFIINGGVLIGLTGLGKQQTSLDLNGLNINQIGNSAFEYCSTLTSINISNSVTSIGNSAFNGCGGLTSIDIPSSVTSIGDRTFRDCKELRSVTFGQNSQLTSIGNNAFTSFIQINLNNCSLINQENFVNISFNNPNPTFIKDNCSININNILNLSELTVKSSYYNESTNTLTIPSNITRFVGQISSELKHSLVKIEFQENSQLTSIGDGAFYNCYNLTTVTFQKNSQLQMIGEGAFSDCMALTTITIPSSVTSIGDYAFGGFCSSLNSVTFESNSQLQSVGIGAFQNCSALTSIDLSRCSLLTINQYVNICTNNPTIKFIQTKYNSQVFNLSNIDSENTTLTIPVDARYLIGTAPSYIETVNFNGNTKIKTIPSGAFSGCSKLNSINIPNSVTSIGDRAFYGCSSLESITIPSSVTTIGDRAFYGCSWLSLVTFEPNSQLQMIGEYAFNGCSSLTSITIPNGVTSIGDSAFYGCDLTNVTFEPNSQLQMIGYNAFDYCSSLTSIDLNPCTFLTIEQYVNICQNNPKVKFIYDKYKSEVFNLSNIDSENTTLTIPVDARYLIGTAPSYIETVNFNGNTKITTIPNYAFRGCMALSSINIPSSVTSIGDYAFSFCGALTSIDIPSSVTTIGDSAFWSCSWLSLVTFQKNSQLQMIGESAFERCRVLTSINIPNSVSSIGSDAFRNCSALNSVTFEPNSQLTSIGGEAFRGCRALTSITIPSSVTLIGEGAFYGCDLTNAKFQSNSKLQMIGDSAFGGCALASIDLSNCTLITPIQQIIIKSNNPNITFTFSK